MAKDIKPIGKQPAAKTSAAPSTEREEGPATPDHGTAIGNHNDDDNDQGEAGLYDAGEIALEILLRTIATPNVGPMDPDIINAGEDKKHARLQLWLKHGKNLGIIVAGELNTL